MFSRAKLVVLLSLMQLSNCAGRAQQGPVRGNCLGESSPYSDEWAIDSPGARCRLAMVPAASRDQTSREYVLCSGGVPQTKFSLPARLVEAALTDSGVIAGCYVIWSTLDSPQSPEVAGPVKVGCIYGVVIAGSGERIFDGPLADVTVTSGCPSVVGPRVSRVMVFGDGASILVWCEDDLFLRIDTTLGTVETVTVDALSSNAVFQVVDVQPIPHRDSWIATTVSRDRSSDVIVFRQRWELFDAVCESQWSHVDANLVPIYGENSKKRYERLREVLSRPDRPWVDACGQGEVMLWRLSTNSQVRMTLERDGRAVRLSGL